jgi:alkylation response protein AidB-like acyl-CoA dehydrogenase
LVRRVWVFKIAVGTRMTTGRIGVAAQAVWGGTGMFWRKNTPVMHSSEKAFERPLIYFQGRTVSHIAEMMTMLEAARMMVLLGLNYDVEEQRGRCHGRFNG